MGQRHGVSRKEKNRQTRGKEEDGSQASKIKHVDFSSKHGEELKVVLLGQDDAVRSSAGNLILGCRAFDTEGRTAQCITREGEILGRKVTVVSAPGWSKLACVDNTPGLTKQEIILSTSHCSPGPHVVLLVTNLEHNRPDQQHVELLGEGVWAHTIVLGTSQKHVSMETQHSTLLEKCDNRLFILENDTSKDREQVKNLIDKMDKLVLQNEGRHYEVERGIIQQLSTKRELEAEEAEERKMAIIRQRKTLEFVLGAVSKPSELNIVLVGNRGSGKTSAVNTILQTQESYIWPTTQCSKHVGSVGGRKVTVVDTPGWGRGALVEYNAPDMISYHLDSSSPTAYILVIQLGVSFSGDDRKSAQTFLNKLGNGVWKKTIVLFTHGEWLGDTPVEQYIESEGSALIWLIEKCQNRFHVLSNQSTSNTTQVTELIEKIDEMAAMAAMTINETESEAETKSQEEFEMEAPNAEEVMREMPHAEERALERTASRSMITPPSMSSCDRGSQLFRTYSMGSLEMPWSSRRSRGSFESTPFFRNRPSSPRGPTQRRRGSDDSLSSLTKKPPKPQGFSGFNLDSIVSFRLVCISEESVNKLDKNTELEVVTSDMLVDSLIRFYTEEHTREYRTSYVDLSSGSQRSADGSFQSSVESIHFRNQESDHDDPVS